MKLLLFFAALVSLGGAGWWVLSQHASDYKKPLTYVNEMKTAAEEIVVDITNPLPDNYPLGSVFMIGHWADTPTASTTAFIREHQVGGVIIMSAPEDPAEIAAWTKEWQAASEYPLIIAIDQEGGEVSRLRNKDFLKISQPEIKIPELAYGVAKQRGQDLAALGITMNFAPVLDAATSSDAFMAGRIFPNDRNEADLGAAMSRGFAESGITAAAKHYPGHPNNATDSHFELPTVDIPRNGLDSFTRIFRNYITKASPEALMTAHVSFPQIDNLPATLSPFFLTTYLRDELGFKGVVITDDVSMDAIDQTWSVEDASVMALTAGADLILLAAVPEDIESTLTRLQEARTDTPTLQTRLKEAMLRVHALRMKDR